MERSESTILVDVSSGRGEFEKDILERMGHAVAVCHGPGHDELCPILQKGGGCESVEGAHGVVFEFDLDRAQHRDILKRYREILKPGIPIRVLVKEGQQEKYPDLLEGAEVWTHEPTVGDMDAFSSRVEAYERVDKP